QLGAGRSEAAEGEEAESQEARERGGSGAVHRDGNLHSGRHSAAYCTERPAETPSPSREKLLATAQTGVERREFRRGQGRPGGGGPPSYEGIEISPACRPGNGRRCSSRTRCGRQAESPYWCTADRTD